MATHVCTLALPVSLLTTRYHNFVHSLSHIEYIVAKAIRDGGIDAVIDHDGGFMASRERPDVYSTAEPQAAFHARIAFCLDLHNEAIKAMRFEPDAHRCGVVGGGAGAR